MRSKPAANMPPNAAKANRLAAIVTIVFQYW